jgi:hypothetical protein
MSLPMRRRLLLSVSLIFAYLPMGLSQNRPPDPKRFLHERTLNPGAAGPNRLLPDAALLAGADAQWQLLRRTTGSEREPMILAAGGLKDLRIYDASNREVPYLLISPAAPESKWMYGAVSPLAAAKKTSGFRIDLGRPRLADRVRLEGIQPPFVKRCVLDAGNDGDGWTRLREEATIFDLPAEKMRSVEIELAPTEYRYLRVTWDDSASARIPLPKSVAVRLVSAGSLPPRLEAPVRVAPRASEPGVSRFRIALPGPRLPITGFRLSVNGGNILRRARITEGRLSGDEIVPHELGAATLRREMRGDSAATEMSIPIESPQEAQVELVIEDGDNPPLDITQVTALFAHLPWIYFESPDKQPLTARYGYAGLNEPCYDLEAMRASAEKAQAAEAHWDVAREIAHEVERAADNGIPGLGAAMDLGGFRYDRSISGSQAGLCTLPLDAAVLAHSRMADLRIAAADGRQIPYLVEKVEEPLALELPTPEKTQDPNSGRETAARSFYRLRFPFKELPAARLVLASSARVFRRELRILVERNPYDERRKPWTESIAEATWMHADPDTAAPALTLKIPTFKATEAILVVEEGDNTPLPITSATLLLPSHRLRFFSGGNADLKLYYGRGDLDAPRYDLAILSPRLIGAAAIEVRLGPESKAAAAKAQPVSMKLFWGILAGAVLVLLVLISRLVKKV